MVPPSSIPLECSACTMVKVSPAAFCDPPLFIPLTLVSPFFLR